MTVTINNKNTRANKEGRNEEGSNNELPSSTVNGNLGARNDSNDGVRVVLDTRAANNHKNSINNTRISSFSSSRKSSKQHLQNNIA